MQSLLSRFTLPLPEAVRHDMTPTWVVEVGALLSALVVFLLIWAVIRGNE